MKHSTLLRKIAVMASLLISNIGFAQLSPLNIGIIPPGKSVVVVYDVIVNSGTSITNQASIAGTNFGTFLSNDPKTAAPNDATVTSVQAITPGAALDFDGLNDLVNVPHNTALNLTTLTAECWIKTNVSKSPAGIIGKYVSADGWRIYQNGANLLASVNTPGASCTINTSGQAINDGVWHHIAFSVDPSGGKVYIDGIVRGSATWTATPGTLTNTAPFYIGYYTGTIGAEYFQGSIDEVRVWNRAQSQCEIANNMNCEIATAGSGLLANYHFNQGMASGNNAGETTLTDASGNAYNGTLTNFALTGATSNWVAPGAVTSGSSCAAYLAPEINVQGNGITIADGDATPSATDHTDFGNANTGGGSVTRTFTIQNENTATGNLTVNSITKTGTNQSEFVISGITLPATIIPGSSATFDVTFTPAAAGSRSAVIHINNNDCDEADYDFAVQGMGTTPATNYYVDDNSNANDVYTTAPGATGNDANPGTQTAPFRTINHALSVALAGSTIFVDAGEFVEQVVVDKSITITGAASSGLSQTTIKAPATLTAVTPNGNNHKVVVYATGAGNTVDISKVVVDGDGRGGSGDDFEGVYYFEAGGSFTQSRIIKVRDAAFSGNQSGIAFFANHNYDVSLTQTVTVSNNTITDYQKSGIVINELNTQGIVTNNIITGQNIENVNGQNGIQFGFGAYGNITGNTVTNNTYNGANSDDAAGILIVGVGVDKFNAPTGKMTFIGDPAGASPNIINGNEVGLLTDAGGFGYDSNAGLVYGLNSFANNLIHVYHNAPATIPDPSYIYDKRIDNTSQTNIVYGQIQRAATDASAGNTLNISANTFTEQVELRKALTLKGILGITTIASPNTLLPYTIGGNTNHPIVYVHDASDVIIRDIIVDGLGKGNANTRFQGIAYYNAGGTVQSCQIKAIRNNPIDGVQGGVALYAYADNGTARTLNATNNTLADFQKNGTVFSGANLTVNFDNNTVTGAGPVNYIAQNGVQVSGGASGTITNNTISNFSYTPNTALPAGVLIFGPGSVQTTGNTVNNAQAGIYHIGSSGNVANNIINYTVAGMGTTPYWYGIIVEDGTFTVSGNEIDGDGNGAGIEADAYAGETTTITATNNKVVDCDEGVVIYEEDATASTNSEIHENSITGSVTKVIHNYGTTTANATCNWYGTANAAVISSKIAGNVTYIPYLTNGTDNDAASGFQPVPNSCNGPVTLTEFYVDDDNNGGDVYTPGATGNDATGDGTPSAPYRTIAKALSMASAGNTIFVDAGSYKEEVNINKSVILKGSNAGTAGNNAVRAAEAVVDGENAAHAGLLVNANNITIDGFKVTGGGGTYNSGVWASSTQSGMQLINNIITDNVIGVYAQSSGASSVRRNLLDGNNRPGPAGGAAIYTEQSNALTIDSNEIKNHSINSAVVFAATTASAHQNLVFSKNNIHNNNSDNSMVYCVGVNGGDFNTNTITQPGTTAIKFAGACTATTVNNNFLDNNGTGVKTADDGYGFGGNSAIQVHENSFVNNTIFAIQNLETTHTVNGTCNWYGTTDPVVVASKVSAMVTYTPYLTNGTDNAPATPGFQPVPGSCNGLTGDSDGDGVPDADDCAPFDPTNTNQKPKLSTSINSVVVISNNDGVNDPAAFSVGNTPNNIVFNYFIDQNAMTGPLIKAYQVIQTTNVSVPFCSNCSASLTAFTGTTGTASLINGDLPGTLVMKFVEFKDDNNNGQIDGSECKGDTVVYTVTVNPNPRTDFYVDDDNNAGDVYTPGATGNDATGNGSPSAPYRTITKALSMASAGNTIYVDAGSFKEEVNINKSVIIKGSNAGTAGNAVRAAEAVVDGENAAHAGLLVNANNVTIDGFKVTGGGGVNNAGVLASSTQSGLQLINNIITDNVIGVYAQSNGASLVKRNLFDGNNRAGAAGGAAIYTEFSNGLTVDSNEIKNHLINSAVIFAANSASAHQNLVFTKNNIHNNNADNSMVYCVGVNGGDFNKNTITQPGTTAIKFAGACTSISVSNNFLDNNGTGVKTADDGYSFGANSAIQVHENSFTNNTIFAIQNQEATHTINATCNWYGSSDPAVVVVTKVSGNVTYIPYLINGTDNDPATPGFQPVPGSCNGGQNCESPTTQAYTSTIQNGNQSHKGELGMRFIVNNAAGIIIKQLGAFDDGGNGITGLQPGGSVQVAIFNRSTHNMVPGLNAFISGSGDAYTGNHRMKNIAPVTLPPGDYVIVAKGYHSGERNGNSLISDGPYPPGNDGGGAVSFGNEATYGPDDPNGFSYPGSEVNAGTSHVYLAGTFSFTKVVPCGGQSTNANLSNLVISQGTLTPAFTPATTSYTASVPNSVTSITVTPTAADATSTITVNGVPVASGSPSGSITLAEGSNIITVVVTAQNGTTTKTYTIDVTRAPGSGGTCESPSTQAYTSTIQNGNQPYKGELGMRFIVNNAAGIIIKQLGAFDDGGTGITGLQPGGSVQVAIFNRSTHNMVPGLNAFISGSGDAYTGNHRMKNIPPVTLPPGDYVIVAKGYHSGERNGNSLISDGPYPPGNDGGGAVSFGNEATYGPDDPNGFSYPSSSVALGTSHVYLAGTFSFTKVVPCGGQSTNANLSNLVISQGTLTPAFTPATTSYTASVPNSVTSITVTPTAADATSTITVNGVPVASGSPSGSITLAEGSNIITVVVTAQDGTTTKTYTIDVTRAPGSGGTCESPSTQAYTSTIQNGNQSHKGELGMQFVVNNPAGIIIKQLGAFDDGGNGITGLQPGGSVQVAIFNRSTHNMVPGLNAFISGSGDAYTGNHRMKNIPPVTLPPGDYVIVAKGYHSGERNGNSLVSDGPYPAGNDGGGAISFGNEASYGPDDPNGFSYPSNAVNVGTSHVYLAGTFSFTKVVPCGGSSTTTSVVTTADAAKQDQKVTPALIMDQDAEVYPNPTRGRFTVRLYNLSVPKVTLQILNETGLQVTQKSVDLSGKTLSLSVPFDLSNQPAGLYFIRVLSDKATLIKKVVVER